MKKMGKKRLVSIILAATLVFTLGACGASKELEAAKKDATEIAKEDTTGAIKEITFVLDWTPNTNHTGIYVAQAQGYFAEEGLEVEIVQPPEDGADLLVASGKAQFGISFQDSMAPGVAGDNVLPTTAVATLVQHNTSGLLARKGEGMERPKGLEGKRYSTWDLPVEKAMVKDIVEKDGGDFAKVELIPSTVTDEVSALESNSTDSIWVFYAWGGIATEVADLATDYIAFKDINPIFDYYTPVLIANNEFLAADKETAKAFLRALKKGYEFAIEDPQAAAEILCAASPELDLEMVVASQNYLKDQYKAEVAQWGYMAPDRWNGFYQWLNENGLSEVEIPMDAGFSNDYLPE